MGKTSSQNQPVVPALPGTTPKGIMQILSVIFLTAGVPATIVAIYNEVLLANIPMAVLLFCGYEIVVFLGGLFAKLYKKSFENPLLEWLYDRIISFFFWQKGRYYKEIQNRYWYFDVKGFSTQGPYNLDLEDVFVELKIHPKPFDQTSANPIKKIPDALRKKSHPVWDFIANPVMKNQNFAVIGAPGCGKTTMVKHMALVFSGKRRTGKKLGVSSFFPLLLFLRDHQQAVSENPDISLGRLAEEWLVKKHFKLCPGWIERKLRTKQSMVLLDGLDEVADPEMRKTMVRWVTAQMEAYARCRFIVTSRPGGYASNPLSGVTVLSVHPFSRVQVKGFVKKWYLANEKMATSGPVEKAEILAAAGAADLIRRIENAPALADLSVNPLLLTMIATVHRYKSSLPGRRVELYKEICEVFLGKRQQSKGLEDTLTPAQKQSVLQPLAFRMMELHVREIEKGAVEKIISPGLEKVDPELTAGEFLKQIEHGSGLLVQKEEHLYSFSHLTFQEYLCSVHINEAHLTTILHNKVSDSWWHEVIRLFAANADASQLIEACIDKDQLDPVSVMLALDCRDEAKAIKKEIRQKLDNMLSLGADNPSLKQTIGQALFMRRLLQMCRIDERRAISLTPVTNVEYQLFLDADPDHNKYKPAHWKKSHFPGGKGNRPVTGVLPVDAQAFCDWYTREEGGGFRYRLPSFPEKEYCKECEHDHHGIWTGSEKEGYFSLFPGKEHDTDRAAGVIKEDVGVLPDITFAGDKEKKQTIPPGFETYLLTKKRHYLQKDFKFLTPGDIEKIEQVQYYYDAVEIFYIIIKIYILFFISNLDLTLDLTFACACSLTRALDRALNLVLTHDLDIDLNLTRVHALDHALDRDRDHALDHALARARDLSHYLANVRAYNFDIDLAHTLARTLARARVYAHAGNFDFDINRARTLASDRDQDLNLVLARKIILFLAYDPDKAAFMDLKIKSSFFDQLHTIPAILKTMYDLVYLKKELAPFNESFLYNVILGIPTNADNNRKWRLAILTIMTEVFHRIKGNRNTMEKAIEKAAASKDDLVRCLDQALDAMGDAYVYLAMLDLREKGKVEAFESFCIVREEMSEE